ncbi:Rne/Rng family ribonuclease [Leucobacter sp. OH1287]|nr:Rne/Rng family ribonuclease [Leucobacter sp. OH1287]
MTPAERFAATKRILFVAPDVPPVPPRARRQRDYRAQEDFFELHGLGHLSPKSRGRGREQSQYDVAEPRQQRFNGESDEPEAEQKRSRKRERGDYGKREERQQVTEPQRVKGSTRLEAKRQRRRDNRETGRRRTVVTESEFLARREAVDRKMVVSTKPDLVQIGVLEDNVLVEHYVAKSSEASLIGNVYLGKVQNVLPSMEAAFVDIGRGRNAVLYSGEVDWSEYTGSNSQRKIENLLSLGDSVLVQVTKDPVGHKGARLTSQISLPGRFLVYVPEGAMNGISRKLPDTERARLKKILKEVVPDSAGVIVRTAAEGATEEQLTRDVKHLTKQWESIQKKAAKGSNSPLLLHSEPDMLIKIVRDVFNEDFQELLISGSETFERITGYLDQVAPDLIERLSLYEGEREIFDKYRITEQIQKALERKVWLPSGGSLVIDRTEAMTVIDVNTGKFVGSGGNLEETVTKNNLEAAEEIVRQLRLRDSGGIIVIDFIDMVLESNRDLVHRRLIECLGRDRTKHQVAEVTSLGLVQMTRKKLGIGLLESFSDNCDACAGRGVVIETELQSGQGKKRKNNAKTTQAHKLDDGAKNMLAKVAAKTITLDDDVTLATSDSGEAAAADAAGSTKKNAKQGAKAQTAKAAKQDAKDTKDAGDADAKTAKSAAGGSTRAGSRRVTKRVTTAAPAPAETAAETASESAAEPAAAAADTAAVDAAAVEQAAVSSATPAGDADEKRQKSAALAADLAAVIVNSELDHRLSAGAAESVKRQVDESVLSGVIDSLDQVAAASASAQREADIAVLGSGWQRGIGRGEQQSYTPRKPRRVVREQEDKPKKPADGDLKQLLEGIEKSGRGVEKERVGDMLGSILSALPDAPAPGEGRKKSRKDGSFLGDLNAALDEAAEER